MHEPDPDPRYWLTVGQIAAGLQVKPSRVWNWVRRNRVVARAGRVYAPSVETYLHTRGTHGRRPDAQQPGTVAHPDTPDGTDLGS